jgi:hypothetical protein
MYVLFLMRAVSERKLCENVRRGFSCTREVDDTQPRPVLDADALDLQQVAHIGVLPQGDNRGFQN